MNYIRSKEIELFLEKKYWHRFFKVAVWFATISCFLLIIVTGFDEFSASKITHRVFSFDVTYDSVDAKPEHISYIRVSGREADRIISRVHDLWRDKTMGKSISPAVEDTVKYYDNVLRFFFERWVREYKSNTVDGYIKESLNSDHVPAILLVELHMADFAERLLKQGDISVKEWHTFEYRILLIALLISILSPPFLFFAFQLFYYKVIIYVVYGKSSAPFSMGDLASSPKCNTPSPL